MANNTCLWLLSLEMYDMQIACRSVCSYLRTSQLKMDEMKIGINSTRINPAGTCPYTALKHELPSLYFEVVGTDGLHRPACTVAHVAVYETKFPSTVRSIVSVDLVVLHEPASNHADFVYFLPSSDNFRTFNIHGYWIIFDCAITKVDVRANIVDYCACKEWLEVSHLLCIFYYLIAKYVT
jgi:hypothetical protein